MMTHDELVQKMLSNPKVKAEYEDLAPEFALLKQMIKARQDAHFNSRRNCQTDEND